MKNALLYNTIIDFSIFIIRECSFVNRFALGVIAGGILGTVGITMALSDRGTRNKLVRSGKKMAYDAGELMNEVQSRMW